MAVFPNIFRGRFMRDMSGRGLMQTVDLGAAYEGEYRFYGDAWGREHDNTGDTTQFTDAIDELVPRENVTILLGHVKTDGTLRSNNAFQSTSGTTGNRCRCILPHTDGKVYWDFGGGVEGSTRCSIGGLTVGDDNWAFTSGIQKGMAIWQNGLLRKSNTGGATRGASASAFQWGQGTSDLCVYRYMIIYNRVLTDAEIQLVGKNPYAFLEPKRYGSLPVASPIKNETVTDAMTIVSTPSRAGSEFTRSLSDPMTVDSVVGKDAGVPSKPYIINPDIAPGYSQGYATGAHDAKYKTLREGCTMALFPKMGATETLRDFSGHGHDVALNAGDAANFSTAPYGQRGLSG
jgi:hypothetical protein